MALIMLGGGVTDIRGSIGGSTFARNAGGNYMRARMKPVNPRSFMQSKRRALTARLATYWSKTLDETQRASWRTYATATTWTNRLGQTIQINGLAAFLRTNALLLTVTSTIQATAPVENGQAGGAAFTFTATFADQKINVSEPSAPWDKDTDDDYLLLHQFLPQSAGVLHVPKASTYLSHIAGNSVAPQTFPLAIAAVYPFVEGQQITVAMVHLDELGRVSGRTYYRAAAVA